MAVESVVAAVVADADAVEVQVVVVMGGVGGAESLVVTR